MSNSDYNITPCTIIETITGGYLVDIQGQGRQVVERRRLVRTATGWGIIQETAKKASCEAVRA